jgi:methylase of polypeptide subunit release factors
MILFAGMTLRVPRFEDVAQLGKFLLDSGYDVAHLSGDLALGHSLHANRDNLDVLLERTSSDTRLHVLARLFFVGMPMEGGAVRRHIPEGVLSVCLDAGVLVPSGDSVAPGCLLMPFRDINVACDAPDSRLNNPNLVVGPTGTTKTLSHLLVGGPVEDTLDLGTGSGVMGIRAAAHSKRVLGTDFNPRAVEFARFSAALNGAANFSAAVGDAFEPAAGRQFSRIIANPPFFLSPTRTFTYCDSPVELDGFCRRLALEAPAFLAEGGFFQMICEWVEVEGETWENRLRGWLAGSGCDALVLTGAHLDPLEYVDRRMTETGLMTVATEHGPTGKDRIRYFQERKVKSVIAGVITMRKRTGSNWIAMAGFNEMSQDAGGMVVDRFRALDFLSNHSEADLLATRFRVADDTVLDERRALGPQGWYSAATALARPSGWGERLKLDAPVAAVVLGFDGRRTLGEIAAAVAGNNGVSKEEAIRRCVDLARRLLHRNFLTPMPRPEEEAGV